MHHTGGPPPAPAGVCSVRRSAWVCICLSCAAVAHGCIGSQAASAVGRERPAKTGEQVLTPQPPKEAPHGAARHDEGSVDGVTPSAWR